MSSKQESGSELLTMIEFGSYEIYGWLVNNDGEDKLKRKSYVQYELLGSYAYKEKRELTLYT